MMPACATLSHTCECLHISLHMMTFIRKYDENCRTVQACINTVPVNHFHMLTSMQIGHLEGGGTLSLRSSWRDTSGTYTRDEPIRNWKFKLTSVSIKLLHTYYYTCTHHILFSHTLPMFHL